MNPMNPMTIPTSAAEISVAWLSGMLPNADIRSASVRRVGVDRGATGEVYEVAAGLPGATRRFVVKTTHPDQWERSLREIRLLESVTLPVHTARILSSEVEASSGRTAIVLSHVAGEDGDAAAGASPAQLETLIHDLALLHSSFRTPEALEKLVWLPRWGAGTSGSSRPHQRRSDRYRSLIDRFVTEHAPTSQAWIPELLRGISTNLEEVLARLAELPPTLIHADAHLDNIVFRKGTAHWLDWQSASLGPGIYDLVRLLAETVDVTTDLALARRLVHAYGSHLAWHGVEPSAIDRDIDHLPDAAVAALVGFVSGFGGRPHDDLTERERRIVSRAASERGLLGFVRHLLVP